jgi:ribonuclease HI
MVLNLKVVKLDGSVHEAELVGILLGMHLISTEKHGSKPTALRVGVDNRGQAAITGRAFHSALKSPGHHLAREILQVANRVKRRWKGKYKLTAGHEGVKGNEDADREAKRAADGKTSEKRFLPPYPRKPMMPRQTPQQ